MHPTEELIWAGTVDKVHPCRASVGRKGKVRRQGSILSRSNIDDVTSILWHFEHLPLSHQVLSLLSTDFDSQERIPALASRLCPWRSNSTTIIHPERSMRGAGADAIARWLSSPL